MAAAPRIMGVVLVLVAALLQVSIVSRIDLADASPDLLILVVTSIALLSGSVSGACHGFLAGIALAVFGGLPLGPHALLGALIGYAVGRVGEALITTEHPAPPLAAGIVATLTMQVGRPLVEFLVNPAVGRIEGVWSQAFLVTALSAALAVPVYLLVRRALVAAATAAPTRASEGVA